MNNPTSAELNLANQVFVKADPGKLGVVTGEAAVKLFSGAKLPGPVLGEIWSIADEDNNGWLSKKGVTVALRLIGWAQSGEKVTSALIGKPGPIPSIEGLTSIASHSTGMSIPKSPPPSLSLPSLTAQDKAKFQRLFQSSGPQNGLLTGEKARDIFVKSKLSVDKLSQIWNLADTKDRGSLDVTDFMIGMYFIQGCMSGSITYIPSSLPPGFYEQVAGIPVQLTGVASHSTGSFNPSAMSLNTPLRPQYTGASMSGPAPTPPRIPARQNASSVGASAFGLTSPASNLNGQAAHWDVTPADKASADKVFNGLDSHNHGYIEGDVAVPFMLESKLSGDDLAQIWDLADIQGDGRLTRDGFAVAMHLIKGKLAGKNIPPSLPASLVPPSLRAATPTAPKHSEIPQDLLWGDDEPAAVSAPSPPPFTPQTQPPATNSFFQSSSFQSSAPPSKDPFGSSSFGTQDLLGDDNEMDTQALHENSAEIGNLQNQVQSTSRSLETAKTERVGVESQLADQAAQLLQLRTQLSSAKASYETETNLLTTLRERYSTQNSEIQKARQDLIRAESDLSAVKVEKSETEGAFLRDKEEARALHRKMLEVGQEAEIVKAEIEKLKKEAKQQKGLLAIAKKQLSTKEVERSKVEKEVAEMKSEVDAITQEKEEAEVKLAQLANMERTTSSETLMTAAAQPLPLSPDVTGAASLASNKSNNPFERLQMSSAHSTPRSGTPVFLPFADASLSIDVPPLASEPQSGTDKAATDDLLGAVQGPTAKSTQNDDPFGFNDAFGGEAVQSPTQEATFPASPTDLASPTSAVTVDQFVTPLSTGKESVLSYTSQDFVTTRFPDIDSPLDVPGHFPLGNSGSVPLAEPKATKAEDTDFNTPLKELDIDDSDSSDDEDEIPLATLAAKATPSEGKAPDITAPGFSGNVSDAPTAATYPPTAATNGDATSTANHDIFGIPTSNVKDAVGSSLAATIGTNADYGFDSSAKPPATSGASAFDETLGNISASGTSQSPPPAQLTFDSAFDDNFDFATASGAQVTPEPSQTTFPPVPGQNGHSSPTPHSLDKSFSNAAPQQQQASSSAFDDVFASGSSQAPNASNKPVEAPTTFDDIFSGLETAPNADITAVSSAPAANASRPLPPPAGSPKGSTISGRAASPPPRTQSPSQFMSSARPRPSITSTHSKEEKEKEKEKPSRSSKISIRLPFGKRKKTSEAPPPPARSKLLTPPSEEPPNGSFTPAVDDDVDAVKQLCGMGFSRSQVVEALEKQGYDVQKALNTLLSQ